MKNALFFILLFSNYILSDVIRPALVELTFASSQKASLVIRMSIEAILTEISTDTNDTTFSPNSLEYDRLRHLPPDELFQEYLKHEQIYLNNFTLLVNNKKLNFKLKSHKVDIVGYAKKPRTSILTYEANLAERPNILYFKYNKLYGDSSFRYRFFEEDKYTWNSWMWITSEDDTGEIDVSKENIYSNMDRFTQFLPIGFYHVIPLGFDHILFIIGMALSSLVFRHLVMLVTSFTIAHTITLGFSMFGLVDLPSSIIEPLIALSIAYIALENLLTTTHMRRKIIIVFLFGLLHGLGFASMLKTFAMTKDTFLSVLIGFNIGVEIAQLLIIIGIISIALLAKKLNLHRALIITTSICIGVIGLYWAYDRLPF